MIFYKTKECYICQQEIFDNNNAFFVKGYLEHDSSHLYFCSKKCKQEYINYVNDNEEIKELEF
jgi:ribosomal protein L24E